MSVHWNKHTAHKEHDFTPAYIQEGLHDVPSEYVDECEDLLVELLQAGAHESDVQQDLSELRSICAESSGSELHTRIADWQRLISSDIEYLKTEEEGKIIEKRRIEHGRREIHDAAVDATIRMPNYLKHKSRIGHRRGKSVGN